MSSEFYPALCLGVSLSCSLFYIGIRIMLDFYEKYGKIQE